MALGSCDWHAFLHCSDNMNKCHVDDDASVLNNMYRHVQNNITNVKAEWQESGNGGGGGSYSGTVRSNRTEYENALNYSYLMTSQLVVPLTSIHPSPQPHTSNGSGQDNMLQWSA